MEYISPAFRLEFREFCTGLALRQIDDVFQNCGVKLGNLPENRFFSGQRRTRIEEYYASINWESVEDTKKFLDVVRVVSSQSFISQEERAFLKDLCIKEGLQVDGQDILLPENKISKESDLFRIQFPGGLPFGIKKPNFAVAAKNGGQSLKFELDAGIGILWEKIYPNFTFQTFREACKISKDTDATLRKSIFQMNQTDCERVFFQTYAKRFDMASKPVPLLIPQAWIQWYSLPKNNLKASSSLQSDDLYRVDFVAFWQNKRYAILVDDISHYAVKHNEKWFADEESYSKRLKEDRRLKQENWNVFRISNWEIRNENNLIEGIESLKGFIGFDIDS
jgi:hypothetical protein